MRKRERPEAALYRESHAVTTQELRAGKAEASAPVDVRVTRKEQIFPVLTTAQIARLARHGQRLATRKGEVLAQPGERFGKLLVVLSGSLEIVLPGIACEEMIGVHDEGHFSAESSLSR